MNTLKGIKAVRAVFFQMLISVLINVIAAFNKLYRLNFASNERIIGNRISVWSFKKNL